MQFRYHAGNNFGTSKEGKSCQGCAEEQEEIYNCADIEILPNLKKIAKLEEDPSNVTTDYSINDKMMTSFNISSKSINLSKNLNDFIFLLPLIFIALAL